MYLYIHIKYTVHTRQQKQKCYVYFLSSFNNFNNIYYLIIYYIYVCVCVSDVCVIFMFFKEVSSAHQGCIYLNKKYYIIKLLYYCNLK